jgi:succinyl-CoA synthetase beta subunit
MSIRVQTLCSSALQCTCSCLHSFFLAGKQLLRKYGVNTQRGDAASNSAEATSIALGIQGVKEYVIKAQVHAGGRGKGQFTNGFKGGVKFTSNPEQAGALAANMIGSNLVTKQTTAAGQPCHKVFVGESVDLASEKYFAILMDRSHNGPVMVGSAQGGMDIEAVAEATPDAIFTLPIDITTGTTSPSPHSPPMCCAKQ